MNTQNTDPTIDEITEPLIGLLSAKFPVAGCPYFVIDIDTFDICTSDFEQAVIELPDGLTSDSIASSAIATLLWKSGSHSLWCGSRLSENDPYRHPLRFRYTKHSFWLEDHFQWNRYLIVDHTGYEERDVEGAQRQVGLLVAYLSNPSNLVGLGPDDLAMF
jgi:hypothetical protein